ncbi:MAG: potassium/proton antiporter, partial [Bacteroidales bacterium]|nr:potassium/proton antiporter [Bacteroidales bacterium]
LALQGTTIMTAAKWLGLSEKQPKIGNDFGIELPDEMESELSEMTLTEESFSDGNRLQDLHFPQGTLVMIVKRGNKFIVPNGQLVLQKGDILLSITNQKE